MNKWMLPLLFTLYLFFSPAGLIAQTPATRLVYLKVDSVKSGERFSFKLRSGDIIKTLSVTFSTQILAGGFNTTENVYVTQVSGPRPVHIEDGGVIPPGTANKILVINTNPGRDKLQLMGLLFTVPLTGGDKFTYKFTSSSGIEKIKESGGNIVGDYFGNTDIVTVRQIQGPRCGSIQGDGTIRAGGTIFPLITIYAGAQRDPAQTGPVSVAFTVPPAEGEQFTIRFKTSCGVTKDLVFTKQQTTAGDYFHISDTVWITQISGPRPVSFEKTMILPNNVVGPRMIFAGAGAPAPKFGIRINKPPAGKSFQYKLYKNTQELSSLTITSPSNLEYFPGGYKIGDTVTVRFVPQNQMGWTNPNRSYIIGNSDIIVDISMGFLAAISINRLASNEKFKFEIRHTGQPKDTLEVNMGNLGGAYFGKNRYFEGDTLYVRQLGGPRLCHLPAYTIMTNTNTFIPAGCGLPGNGDSTQHRIGIRIPDLEPGGFYRFTVPTMGALEGIYVDNKDSVFYFLTTFYNGDTVSVTQSSGPKTVTLSPLPAIVTNGDLILTGYFGTPPPPPSKTKLAGTYSGLPGSRIVIRSGNNEELTITADANGVKGFRFPKEYAQGENYSLSIKTPPPNCNCAIVPAATGSMPVDSTELSIICTQAIELVSRSSDNRTTNTFYEATAPVVGGKGADEGRYVAFVSSGAGLDGSLGKYRQIYWRDVKSGITKMISRAPDGSEGDNSSYAPSISADGLSVAFESYATNLVPGDNNGVRDVYVWKQGSGISCVSRGGNSESYEPAIAGNGQSVVFSSGASNLTAGVDGNSTINIYRAGISGGMQLLSMDPKTGKGVGGYAPHISDDGNKVVFCSYSDKLVQDDKNSLWDIFLWQTGNTNLKKISMTASGGDRDQGTESASRVVQASISGNGNYIVYATTATNMVSGDNNKQQDIFICDIGGTGVRRLSVTANNTEGDGDSPIEQGGRIGISYDGKWICYQTNASNLGLAKGNIVLQNTQTGRIIPVTNSIYNATGRPMISRYAASVVAGCSEKLDKRYTSSGIFEFFTGPQVSSNQ